jgi:hypothetical protein
MLARMSSAVLVQRKGFGSALLASMQALIAFSRSATELNTPRLRARSVNSAKKRSTWLIHDADVGVKCTCQRGRLANQWRINFVLCVP